VIILLLHPLRLLSGQIPSELNMNLIDFLNSQLGIFIAKFVHVLLLCDKQDIYKLFKIKKKWVE